MSIQYITKVGPGLKYKSDKMTKTSPIETTDEIFGSRTLIVETNTETHVRIAHVNPNSPGRDRLYKAAGIDRAMMNAMYSRQALGCSFHRMKSLLP